MNISIIQIKIWNCLNNFLNYDFNDFFSFKNSLFLDTKYIRIQYFAQLNCKL